MAKPETLATTAPTSVAESGRRLELPHVVQCTPRTLSTREGIGSVGPATPYPEYSMTVGQGAVAVHVEP